MNVFDEYYVFQINVNNTWPTAVEFQCWVGAFCIHKHLDISFIRIHIGCTEFALLDSSSRINAVYYSNLPRRGTDALGAEEGRRIFESFQSFFEWRLGNFGKARIWSNLLCSNALPCALHSVLSLCSLKSNFDKTWYASIHCDHYDTLIYLNSSEKSTNIFFVPLVLHLVLHLVTFCHQASSGCSHWAEGLGAAWRPWAWGCLARKFTLLIHTWWTLVNTTKTTCKSFQNHKTIQIIQGSGRISAMIRTLSTCACYIINKSTWIGRVTLVHLSDMLQFSDRFFLNVFCCHGCAPLLSTQFRKHVRFI